MANNIQKFACISINHFKIIVKKTQELYIWFIAYWTFLVLVRKGLTWNIYFFVYSVSRFIFWVMVNSHNDCTSICPSAGVGMMKTCPWAVLNYFKYEKIAVWSVIHYVSWKSRIICCVCDLSSIFLRIRGAFMYIFIHYSPICWTWCWFTYHLMLFGLQWTSHL